MKRIVLRVLTTAVVLTLASCGGESEKEASPASGKSKSVAGATEPTGSTGRAPKRRAAKRTRRSREPSRGTKRRSGAPSAPKTQERPKRSRTRATGPGDQQGA